MAQRVIAFALLRTVAFVRSAQDDVVTATQDRGRYHEGAEQYPHKARHMLRQLVEQDHLIEEEHEPARNDGGRRFPPRLGFLGHFTIRLPVLLQKTLGAARIEAGTIEETKCGLLSPRSFGAGCSIQLRSLGQVPHAGHTNYED